MDSEKGGTIDERPEAGVRSRPPTTTSLIPPAESGFYSASVSACVNEPHPSRSPRLDSEAPRRFPVTRSAAMRRVYGVLERLAPTEVTVTLIGETGSGKDVFARTLHRLSARLGSYVVFDCAAVAANLAESELLGHERGSFTGAHAAHAGAFERAAGGTLFLDEVGELPIDLQTRLLRVLESHSVRRVGGRQDRPIDVRVVAASNRDLKAEVAAGRFRQDLYFRLAAAVIQVPPLRERLEDLPELVPSLLHDLGRSDLRVAESVYALLAARYWAGNVRELKNSLAYALAFADGNVLEPRHFCFLDSELQSCPLDRLPLAGWPLDLLESEAIKQTLRQTGGNKSRTAHLLGIANSTLYEKLKKYDMSGG